MGFEAEGFSRGSGGIVGVVVVVWLAGNGGGHAARCCGYHNIAITIKPSRDSLID